jgi:hypothetical protein
MAEMRIQGIISDGCNDVMLIQPIDVFVYAWLVVAVLSAAYVAWDQFRGNPEPVVMKWGLVLVTLYMGPIGLLLYVMADKEPTPGAHEEFIKPIMTRETPAAAMRDMAAVDPRDVTATYGLDAHGAQPLAPRVEDGVKVFDLVTSVVRWQILPNVSLMMHIEVAGDPTR